jgi:UDP-N-acetylmuramate dehydrogenase
MHIGGIARYFAELMTKQDAEEAWRFAAKHRLPLIPIGAGSNTIFADETIEAVVIHVQAEDVKFEENCTRVQAGKYLASLVTECAKQGLDLSVLTGIPGTVGGAIVGNAGQGPKGIWTDAFVQTVTAFVSGQWKTFTRAECGFQYRESIFKTLPSAVIWAVDLIIPKKETRDIEAEIVKLLKHRREAQPSSKTAGSCFKALPDGTPSWKIIEGAGLRGHCVGGIHLSEKHANFLMNENNGTFKDACSLVQEVRKRTGVPLKLEMRFYDSQGRVAGEGS